MPPPPAAVAHRSLSKGLCAVFVYRYAKAAHRRAPNYFAKRFASLYNNKTIQQANTIT